MTQVPLSSFTFTLTEEEFLYLRSIAPQHPKLDSILARIECPIFQWLDENLVLVAPQSGIVGIPQSLLGCYQCVTSFLPQVEVTLTQPISISQYPVTVGVWNSVSRLNVDVPYQWGDIDPEYPITNVSYNQVSTFLLTLNNITPRDVYYRLPTEAEWELVAKCGENDYIPPPTDIFSREKAGFLTPTYKLIPNANGIYGMYGNIWEFVEDAWTPDHSKLPEDGKPTLLVSSDVTVKGGSYLCPSDACMPYTRKKHPGGVGTKDTGFRLVREGGHFD